MISIEISACDLESVSRDRFDHAHPVVQRRAWTVWLKASGWSYGEIAEILQIDMDTVTAHIRLYKTRGLEGLRSVCFHRHANSLAPHTATLEAYRNTCARGGRN